MSISSVGAVGSIVSAAFRQEVQNQKAASVNGKEAAGATDGSDSDTATMKLLRQQLADAQAKLQADERSGAAEQTLRTDRQRVQAASSALAYAMQKQAEEAQRAARAAGGGSPEGQHI